jgi:hypothetical protein
LSSDAILFGMKTLRARVEDGRLVPEQPTQLPEGAVIELAIIDDGSDDDDADRNALHAVLANSDASLRAGKGIPAEDVLRELDLDG